MRQTSLIWLKVIAVKDNLLDFYPHKNDFRYYSAYD